MKSLINEIRMYIAELMIFLQIKLAPNTVEGNTLLKHLINYLYEISIHGNKK